MLVAIPGEALSLKKLSREHAGRKLGKPISIKSTLKGAEAALVFLRMDGLHEPGVSEISPQALEAAQADILGAFGMDHQGRIEYIREKFMWV